MIKNCHHGSLKVLYLNQIVLVNHFDLMYQLDRRNLFWIKLKCSKMSLFMIILILIFLEELIFWMILTIIQIDQFILKNYHGLFDQISSLKSFI